MPMPGADRHPSKGEAADHLERYADKFRLPVHLDSPVARLSRDSGTYVATIRGRRVQARRVVVATGAHRRPVIPRSAGDLDRDIVQLSSTDYRSPAQLPDGPVLIVGAANSGAEIALDIAQAGGRAVTLAGRDVGRLPKVGPWFFSAMRHVRTDVGPGRRLALHLGGRGDPLGRVRPADLAAAGVRRVGRIDGVVDGAPSRTGEYMDRPMSVVWCTGLRPDLDWLADDLSDPVGVVAPSEILWIGWPYQRTAASHLMGGVGLDAAALVARMTSRRVRAWSL